MFAEKIRLTDEYIDLIIKKRKEHGFTAYQLSEHIGKNKSWLPNIENHRIKYISREDLLSIFKDFAAEENLDTENYIIKYLHPNAMIELDNGKTVPCIVLQNDDTFLQYGMDTESLMDIIEPYTDELPLECNDIELKSKLSALSSAIIKNYKYESSSGRSNILKLMNGMIYNFDFDTNMSLMVCGIPIFNDAPPNIEDCNCGKDFIKNMQDIVEEYRIGISYINAKVALDRYTDESVNGWTISKDILECENKNYETISNTFFEIKSYIHNVFIYIGYANQYTSRLNKETETNYRKYFFNIDRIINRFIECSGLSASPIKFNIPDGECSMDQVYRFNSEVNDILFQLEDKIRNKYKKK